MDSYSQLRMACFETPLFDTHEHLWSPKELALLPPDFLWTFQQDYVHRDLVSASLGQEPNVRIAFDLARPLDERIAAWWPAWQRMCNTGYARMIEVACRDLFGIPAITPSAVPALNACLTERQKPGWIEQCLARAGVGAVVRDPFRQDCTADYPPQVGFAVRVDDFTRRCLSRHAIYPLEERTGVAIHSLDGMVQAMRRDIEQSLATGRVHAWKLAHAYFRPVAIGPMDRAEAERSFERLVHQAPGSAINDPWADLGADSQTTWTELRPLHDYLIHHFIAWAEEYGRPVQVHLGIQEGSGNFLAHGRPTDLTPIFLRYPRVRFDLLHAGYPYWREVGVLAKNFPNVYADLCWTHILSPVAARQVMDEWLDLVPAAKILAFGGDVDSPERLYGHARIARDNVYRVLLRRVEEEGWGEEQAASVARLVLWENGRSLFGLPGGQSHVPEVP